MLRSVKKRTAPPSNDSSMMFACEHLARLRAAHFEHHAAFAYVCYVVQRGAASASGACCYFSSGQLFHYPFVRAKPQHAYAFTLGHGVGRYRPRQAELAPEGRVFVAFGKLQPQDADLQRGGTKMDQRLSHGDGLPAGRRRTTARCGP